MFTKRKYTDNEKRAVYHKMLNYAHDSVRTNRSIVLDGTFHKKEFREKFQDKWQPKDLTFIEVTAEEPLAFTRLQKPREYSEADIEVYKKLRKEWEPFKEEHLILRSTDDNIENMLSQAKAYLRFNNDKRGNK